MYVLNQQNFANLIHQHFPQCIVLKIKKIIIHAPKKIAVKIRSLYIKDRERQKRNIICRVREYNPVHEKNVWAEHVWSVADLEFEERGFIIFAFLLLTLIRRGSEPRCGSAPACTRWPRMVKMVPWHAHTVDRVWFVRVRSACRRVRARAVLP
jgi:hypothetical protein